MTHTDNIRDILTNPAELRVAVDAQRAKQNASWKQDQGITSENLPWAADVTADMDDGTKFRARRQDAASLVLLSKIHDFEIIDSKGRRLGMSIVVDVEISGDAMLELTHLKREEQPMPDGWDFDRKYPKGTHNALAEATQKLVDEDQRESIAAYLPGCVFVSMIATRDGRSFGAMQGTKNLGAHDDPATWVAIEKAIAKRIKTSGSSYARKLKAGKL